jgi:hypothetical protein
MYSSPRAHTTLLSPHPISRSPTAAIIGEGATSSHRPRRSPMDTYHHGPLAHEQGEWSRNRHKFWVYESSPSSSSQDSRSNASSGGNSTGSEGSGERRARTVSPYGSFFADEMEFDTTPTGNLSFYGGNGQENAAVYTDMNGVFHPTRSWTSSQTQVAPTPTRGPVHFVTGSEYPTYARPPLGPVPVPIHDATRTVRRVPLSQSSLAENSRRSQPPTSWRQGYHDNLDRSNSTRWQSPRRDPPRAQLVTASPPPGRLVSLSGGHDERQSRRVAHGRRRR